MNILVTGAAGYVGSICAEVCPVPDCITMVNELQFENNDNLYSLYQQNRDEYNQFLEKHGIPLHPELIEKAKKTAAVHQQPVR